MPDERKRNGVHYTPPTLARFLADRLFAVLPTKTGPLRVIDPACGDGELLVAAAAAARDAGVRELALTGFDLDEAAIAAARLRLRDFGGELTLDRRDFTMLDRLPRGSFDAMIVNPPYVRTQSLGSATARRLAARFGLRGRVDLTHVFVTLSPQVLGDTGVLGLLCSNRFLTTKAGQNVRTVLDESFSLREVFDLGDTKLFRAAVLPAVVVARVGGAADPARFARVYESGGTAAAADLFALLRAGGGGAVEVAGRTFHVDDGVLERGPDSSHPWRLVTPRSRAWHERVRRNTWCTFGDLAKIRVGIKTTADAVFIRDDWQAVPADCRPEEPLLLPLLTHENVRKWSAPTTPATRVLYPYDRTGEKRTLLPMERYPRAMRYFDTHARRLTARTYVVAAGREWFEIWVPQQPARWARPKLVFPDISVDARFCIDRSGAVVNGDCYWIGIDDLPGADIAYLMLGVANSRFGVRFYDEVCANKLYAGRRRWITQYVGRLPLPDPELPGSQHIVSLAQRLCAAQPAETVALQEELDAAVEDVFLDDRTETCPRPSPGHRGTG